MNRLDKYLFRQGAVPFFLILLCTTAVVWLTQVLQRVELMVEDGGSLTAFLNVTVLLIPSLMVVIIPFALLAAVLYSVNVLAVDNELPVMAGAGASRLRIARPMIFLSVLASVMVLVINVDLLPRSYRMLKNTVEDVRGSIASSLIQTQIFNEVSAGVTVTAEEARPGNQYVGLLIHDARDPLDQVTYTAERGLFEVTNSSPRLLLLRGTIQRVDPETGAVEILRFIETAIDLATFEDPDRVRHLDGNERFVSELLNPDLSVAHDAENAGQFIAEGHARLATPLYPLAFTLLALAFMLSAAVSRRGYGRQIVYTAAAAVGLRTVGFVVQSLATENAAYNVVQYMLPLGVIVIAGALLVGPFWKGTRRRTPDLSTVLGTPSRTGAAS